MGKFCMCMRHVLGSSLLHVFHAVARAAQLRISPPIVFYGFVSALAARIALAH